MQQHQHTFAAPLVSSAFLDATSPSSDALPLASSLCAAQCKPSRYMLVHEQTVHQDCYWYPTKHTTTSREQSLPVAEYFGRQGCTAERAANCKPHFRASNTILGNTQALAAGIKRSLKSTSPEPSHLNTMAVRSAKTSAFWTPCNRPRQALLRPAPCPGQRPLRRGTPRQPNKARTRSPQMRHEIREASRAPNTAPATTCVNTTTSKSKTNNTSTHEQNKTPQPVRAPIYAELHSPCAARLPQPPWPAHRVQSAIVYGRNVT